MISSFKWICFVSFCLFVPSVFGGKFRREGKDMAFSALEKAVEFYKTRYKEVNLDSVFGLRVAEGFLEKLNQLDETGDIGKHDKKRIKSILDDANSISKKAMRTLKENNPSYFNKFKPILQKTWTHAEDKRIINQKLIQYSSDKEGIKKDGFSEKISDKCMTNIMGSNPNSKHRCRLPDDCWGYMIKKNAGNYYLTHQALYFLLAEDKGCHKQVIKKFGGEQSRTKHLDYIAANIFHEMNELYKSDFESTKDKDLFVEQCVLLGMLGAEESITEGILKKIISWQDKSGCFKSSPTAIDTVNSNPSTGRKLLVERELDDGCLSHMTGLGTGYFGIYIYYTISKQIEENSSQSETRTNINLLSYQAIPNQNNELGMSLGDETFSKRTMIYGFLILACFIGIFIYLRLKRRKAYAASRQYRRL